MDLAAEEGGMGLQFGSHGQQGVGTGLAQQGGHAAVEGLGRLAAAGDVREHHAARPSTAHLGQVLQGHGERGHIVAVGVVDQGAAMHALQHFQAHGHGRQVGHTFGDGGGGLAQVQQQGGAVQGVLDGGVVREGDVEHQRDIAPHAGDAGAQGHGLLAQDVQPGALLPRPAAQGQALGELAALQGLGDHGLVRTVHQHLRISEEAHLLQGLLQLAGEVLAVCRTDVGEQPDGGLDDGAQAVHLAGLADARFEDAQGVFRTEVPHAEGHAHLAVPAAGAAHDVLMAAQQVEEPFLHHRLAVAAGDAHHGQGEVGAVPGGDALQGIEGVRHVQGQGHAGGGLAHHGALQAALHQLGQVAVPIMPGTLQGQEQGALLGQWFARVDQQVLDQRVIAIALHGGAQRTGDRGEAVAVAAHRGGVWSVALRRAVKQLRHRGW